MFKRLIIPALFGAFGAVVLLSLGLWQLQRLAWKDNVLREIAAQITADPVALPAQPQKSKDQYLPVRVTGQFTGEGVDVLVSRKQIGPGYRVLAVFETEGRRFLVDRGFLPSDQRNHMRPDQGAGVVTVTGNLLWPDEVDSFTPPPDSKTGIWYVRDVPKIADFLRAEPILIVQSYASYDDPMVEAMPVDVAGIPNDHLGYAVQWFGLAIVWLAMTGYFIWAMRRKSV